MMNRRITMTRGLLVLAIAVPFSVRALNGQACAPESLEPPATFFQGMVAWWPATGSATAYNDLIGAHNIGGYNGTPIGNVALAPGKVGQAFSLDGVTGYIEIASNDALQPASALTLDAWVYPTSLPSNQGTIISKYDSSQSQDGASYVLLMKSTGQIRFGVYGEFPAVTLFQEFDTDIPVLTPGVWQHVAATYDFKTQVLAIYVNGQLEPSSPDSAGQVPPPSMYQSGTPVEIGAYELGQNNWPGLLDEVHLFERALSTQEIQAIYNAGSAGLCPQARLAHPTLMGVSIGNTTGTPSRCTKSKPCASGTAGLLVYSTSDPSKDFILGSNHVLSAVGPTFCPGTASAGTRTLQPGTGDIGADPGNDDFYHVASFTRGTTNRDIDAGLSQLVDPTTATTGIFGIGEPNPHVGVAYPGEPVTKSGEATGVTTGKVTTVDFTFRAFNLRCLYFHVFHNQITIRSKGPGQFSLGGDSGSAVLDGATNTPVGLVVGGFSSATVANPINKIYVDLGVFPVSPGGTGPTQQELEAEAESLKASTDPRLARLEEIQTRHEDEVLRIAGVQGIGIGLDESGHDLVFHVYVTKRSAALAAAVPRDLDRVPVRFIETGGEFETF